MLTNNLRERWLHYLVKRTDENDVARIDLWWRGIQQLKRMKMETRDARPAPAGAPAPVIFSGVSWQQIGPQPLRIDAEQNFQGSGPDSGEVVDIAIDPTGGADQVIYVATNNGGVWKSVDGGATWQPKTDFMPSLAMGAIALDPVDHQILYAGTGNNFDGGDQHIRGAGIYRSIDAGETWTQLSAALFLGKNIERIVVPTPNVLLVATNSGLFRSVNSGVSFGANSPNFDDGNAVLAGAISDLELDLQNNAKVYASVRGSGILVSTDGGVTYPTNLFTATNGAPSASFDWINFVQAPSDPLVMYALVTDSTVTPRFKGLFRSSDGGANWTLQPGAAAPAAEHGGLQNAYDVTLGVDPLDSNRVYIGFQELYRSLDGGLNFGTPAITANQVHFDHHAIVFTPHLPGAAPTPFYVGTDGGIARNNDGNTNWTNLNETVATNLFYGIDIGRNSTANNQFTYGGCQDTGTAVRRPGFAGNDWHEGVNGDGGPVVVDPNNPLRAYGRDGFPPDDSFVVTADGGATWTFVTAAASGLPNVTNGRPDAAATPMGVDPNSSAVVYVASGTQLFRSTNTAATFTLMHTFPAVITAFVTTKLDSKVLLVGCFDGSVHRTANADTGAASTWTQLTVNGAPGQPVGGIAMDPTDNKIAVVTYVGINGIAPGNRTKHVFSSADVTTTALEDISGTDGGDPDANVPDLPVHTVVFDHSTSPHSIIIGCDIDVLRSTDNGATWHIYGAALPNADCTSLQADYALSPPLIRVGTYGRSVFELSRLSGPNIFIMSNLAFGDVAQGSSSDLPFTIFNIGDANLTISDISDPSANPNFSLVGPPAMPFDIVPGATVTITLRFTPAAPGKQIVMYSVTSSSVARPVFGISVSGAGGFSGPEVSGVIPSSGPAAGGTAVTVHGSGLTGATAVNFGTQAATGLVVNSDTQVLAVTPVGGGVVDVTVVTPAGTTAVNSASHFTYLGATVSVTGINPTQGPSTGGTSVVISGAGFTGATQVLFGAFAASGFTVDSDSQVTAVSPAGNGIVDVLVATIAGTSPVNPADKFTYTVPGGGTATGGGTGTGTVTGTGAGPTGEEDVLHALADILRSGTDPEVLEAQRILLRRIALEGNIIDSRVPPPKNITEVGGYVNLLTTLGHTDIRTQMLASVLGVAGPATPVGLSGEAPALAFIPMPNDRPTGNAQATFTTAITVRSDVADAFALAMQRVHGFGCALPLYTPARVLPFATPGQILQPDLLEILGRVLKVAPRALLADPASDSVAIARLSSDPPDRWQLVVQEIDGQSRVAPASWVAYQASDANVTTMPPASRQYMPIAAILADAGWYSSQPFAAPISIVAQGSLPRLINVTGLVRGQTKLGDELLLLYSRPTVMASALAGMLSWVWNGTTFVPGSAPAKV
jgi:hypothetical protein